MPLSPEQKAEAIKAATDAINALPGPESVPAPPPAPTMRVHNGTLIPGQGQLVENVTVNGSFTWSPGVRVKNLHVRHPGGVGIYVGRDIEATGENIKVENINAPLGVKPNPDEVKNIELNRAGK